MIIQSCIDTYDELLRFCGTCKLEEGMDIKIILLNVKTFEKIFKLHTMLKNADCHLNQDSRLFLFDNDIPYRTICFLDAEAYKEYKESR